MTDLQVWYLIEACHFKHCDSLTFVLDLDLPGNEICGTYKLVSYQVSSFTFIILLNSANSIMQNNAYWSVKLITLHKRKKILEKICP